MPSSTFSQASKMLTVAFDLKSCFHVKLGKNIFDIFFYILEVNLFMLEGGKNMLGFEI